MIDLNEMKKLGPFEFSEFLIKVAAKNKAGRAVLDAGRGNPNWINTTARRAFSSLLEFAIEESERTLKLSGLAGWIKKDGIYDRFLKYLEKDEKKNEFLKKATAYCVDKMKLEKDDLIAEFCNGAIGNNYPVPSRILVNTEKICSEYLGVGKDTKLFGTEGASAAMCYIFKSLKINGILKKGDKIAINTPVFPPYLEMPKLKEYDLVEIDLESKEKNNWELLPEQFELLKNKEIKILFLVNPSNPGSRALSENSLKKLKEFIEKEREDLIVLSDEVYGNFIENFKSVYSVIPYNTILVYSYSKIFGTTGVRLGVVALNDKNILDDKLKNISDKTKEKLEKRYAMVTLKPDEISFIDRLSIDSRDVALSHTSGLSTTQQVLMSLFSLVGLCDTRHTYIKNCRKLVSERYDALYHGLGIVPDESKENSKYYTILDIYEIAEKLYGKELRKKIQKKADSMDFLYYLASNSGVILIDGLGFKSTAGTLRVSHSNLPKDAYEIIGKSIVEMIESYKE